MAEKMVRCPRCYEVFDADEGSCPKCGTPYRAPAPQPKPIDGLYTVRYAPQTAQTGEPEAPMPTFAPGPKPPRKLSPNLMIGTGVVLVVAAAALVFGGALGGSPAPADPPVLVQGEPKTVASDATQPPIVGLALDRVGGLRLDAHVIVDTKVLLSKKVDGTEKLITTHFDGQVAQANQSGTVWSGGTIQEMRLVDGLSFVRTPPSGTWSMVASLPAYLLVSPMFGINSSKDLSMQGPAMREGQLVNHLQSTSLWVPDMSRLAMTDLSGLPVQPDTFVLDLWVGDDGVPSSATVSATKTDESGARLIDVAVTYTFSDVGVHKDVIVPMSPLPSLSPGASPGAAS